MGERLLSHRQLDVYKRAFEASMAVFELSRRFPREETYSLTDQIRRSSRSVCANITEAWRKRRYEGAFVSKLSNAESEAAETQTWLEYVVKCGYAGRDEVATLYKEYEKVLKTIVGMIIHSDKWVLPVSSSEARARSRQER
jgi:four helix bundle protein